MTFRRMLLSLSLSGLTLVPQARADEPAIKLSDLQQAYDRLLPSLTSGDRPEAAEQLMMLLFSTPTQGLPGWYGDGASRYDWIWLAARFDQDRDGKVGRKEFHGPDDAWARLDRDADGAVTRDDLDWSDNSDWGREEAQAQARFRALDQDGDGTLSAEEWAAPFDRVAGTKGTLDPAAFRQVFASKRTPRNTGMLDPKTRAARITGVLKGDVGSFNEGPRIGDLAPDFTLKTQDGKGPVTLSSFRGKRPVVLTFGSYTCPPYRALFGGLDPLHKQYGDRAEFLAVYVREAHPVDGWVIDSNDKAGIEITQPHDQSERLKVAGTFCEQIRPNFPLLVDEFDDAVGHAYSGMPNRLYIIDRDGRVAYKSGRGPRGYKTAELEQALILLLMDQTATAAH